MYKGVQRQEMLRNTGHQKYFPFYRQHNFHHIVPLNIRIMLYGFVDYVLTLFSIHLRFVQAFNHVPNMLNGQEVMGSK